MKTHTAVPKAFALCNEKAFGKFACFRGLFFVLLDFFFPHSCPSWVCSVNLVSLGMSFIRSQGIGMETTFSSQGKGAIGLFTWKVQRHDLDLYYERPWPRWLINGARLRQSVPLINTGIQLSWVRDLCLSTMISYTEMQRMLESIYHNAHQTFVWIAIPITGVSTFPWFYQLELRRSLALFHLGQRQLRLVRAMKMGWLREGN